MPSGPAPRSSWTPLAALALASLVLQSALPRATAWARTREAAAVSARAANARARWARAHERLLVAALARPGISADTTVVRLADGAGEGGALAAARTRQALEAYEARVTGLDLLTDSLAPNLRTVSVKATFEGTAASVLRGIAAIEGERPCLTVRDLELSATEGASNGEGHVRGTVRVDAVVVLRARRSNPTLAAP